MSKDEIAVSATLHAPASEVWSALTSPERIKDYLFGSNVDTDWKPGSPIIWRGEFQGKRYEDHGEVREVDQRRKLSFTHVSGASGDASGKEAPIVTYDLEDRGDWTDVTVAQTHCGGKPEQVEKNWMTVVEALRANVEH